MDIGEILKLDPLNIELGSGDHPVIDNNNYIHVDIRADQPHVEVVANCDKLPFPDNTVNKILNQHLIEHIPREKLNEVLKEWLRVLKPGGKVEIICPNLSYIALHWMQGSIDKEQLRKWIYGGQDYAENFHYNGFDYGLITKSFLEAGFAICTPLEEYYSFGLHVEAQKALG